MKRIIRLGIIISMCFATSGCLYRNYTTTEETGKKISDSTLQQLDPGKTTREFVLSTLGSPSSRDKQENGTEIFKYTYTKKIDEKIRVFLLFASNKAETTIQIVCLEFKNDLLTRFWTEKE